jgi:hypothetical protein
VQRDQLPYLEHVTRNIEKVSVGIMNSSRKSIQDPFDAAYSFKKVRDRKLENRRLAAEKERKQRQWDEERAERAGVINEKAGPSFSQRKAGGVLRI